MFCRSLRVSLFRHFSFRGSFISGASDRQESTRSRWARSALALRSIDGQNAARFSEEEVKEEEKFELRRVERSACAMSKLKRKKAEPNSEFRVQQNRLINPTGAPPSSSGGLWWAAADLEDVEKLWSVTLQAFCPAASSSPAITYQVPPLPEPPMREEREEREEPGERRWCGLEEDVGELPSLKDPSERIRTDTAPHSTPEEEDLQLEPSTAEQRETGGEQQTLSSSQRPLQEDQARCSGAPVWVQRRPGKPDWSREGQWDGGRLSKGAPKSGNADSKSKIKPGRRGEDLMSGSHSDGAEKMQGGKLAGRESGKAKAGSSKSRAVSRKGSDEGPAPAPGPGPGPGVSVLENDSECRAGTSGGGTGSGQTQTKLECCPMCLMPFPAGFSQMECDGHLALCLSEMNTDVVW